MKKTYSVKYLTKKTSLGKYPHDEEEVEVIKTSDLKKEIDKIRERELKWKSSLWPNCSAYFKLLDVKEL